MPRKDKNTERIFLRWFNNEATEEEVQKLQVLVKDAEDKALSGLLQHAWENPGDLEIYGEQRQQRLVKDILEHYPAGKPQPVIKPPRHFWRNTWLRYAAVIILMLGAGGYLFYYHSKQTTGTFAKGGDSGPDIAPGRTGAILTLADGSRVVLDSLSDGMVADQSGTRIILNNGQLAYEAGKTDEARYNTVTTPRGRQFQIRLPDGSKVWLNAASSIRYPTAFTGPERRVEISGEVYFEIEQNAKMPFHVRINKGVEIEVLGTHFNVNAYADEEDIHATLLEGRIRVVSGSAEEKADRKGLPVVKNKVILKPGQQAKILPTADIFVEDADIEKTMAWKNGAFNFDNATLDEVMKQLARWYDIEVAYEGGSPAIEFYGSVGRNLTLSHVLRALEVSKVNFRVEGRKLVVLP